MLESTVFQTDIHRDIFQLERVRKKFEMNRGFEIVLLNTWGK